jgi:hypothetical protein
MIKSKGIKRLAFDALDIKAIVTKDRVQVQGVIPMDLVTIEQTSGCMFTHNKNHRTRVFVNLSG